MLNLRRYNLLWVTVISCAMLAAACDDDDDELFDGDDAAEDANAAGEDLGVALAEDAAVELTGQPPNVVTSQIGAMLLEIDIGEIEQAEFELDLGVDQIVLDFAARMLDEHSRHDELVDDYLDARRLEPIPGGVSNTLAAGSGDEIVYITSEASDLPPVDFRYLEAEVRMHASAEVLVDSLIGFAPDAALRDLLIATRDQIAAHRDEAYDLLYDW